MRSRLLIPILLLLVAFCGVIGYVVYANVTDGTKDLIVMQVDESLEVAVSRLNKLKADNPKLTPEQYQEVVEGLGVIDGGVLIISRSGEVYADSLGVMSGQLVDDQKWFEEVLSQLSARLEGEIGQTRVYAHSISMSEIVIVSYLSTAAIESIFTTPLYMIGVVGAACVVIVGMLMYFILTRFVIHPIESFDDQTYELDVGDRIDLKTLKICPELNESGKQVNKILDVHTSIEANLRRALRDGAYAAGGGSTSFEFVGLLRQVFESYRETVKSKKLKFSLLIDNDMPGIIFANRDTMFADLSALLGKAFSESRAGTKIDADASLAPTPAMVAMNDRDVIMIRFAVQYGTQEESILLEAKKG